MSLAFTQLTIKTRHSQSDEVIIYHNIILLGHNVLILRSFFLLIGIILIQKVQPAEGHLAEHQAWPHLVQRLLISVRINQKTKGTTSHL